MTGEQYNKDSGLTPTRRQTLKLAAGTTTVATFGAAPVTAQKQERQQWVFNMDYAILSSPTVVDGTVFIGNTRYSDDRAIANLFAIDASTGSQQWEFELSGEEIVESSPAVSNGSVFVGDHGGSLQSVDVETGEKLWTYQAPSRFESSPTVADDSVFISTDNLHAVDTETADQIWTFEPKEFLDSSPTVTDGSVFVGGSSGEGESSLYAVNANTGYQQWAFKTGDYVDSSPTVVDGTVFVGSRDDNLYAVDAKTGIQKWAFETGDSIISSPSVANDTVFVGSGDTNLYAVDAETGTQKWAFETGGRIYSSPTVVDGTIFVGSYDTNLYAVDAETGERQWAFETGGRIYSSPTVVDGTIFVGSNDNNLYAIDADVDGSSEGSRVRLKTLGHHDVNLGDNEPSLFDFTIDAPSEAVAGNEVTISVDAQAVDSQISAFQVSPDEQPDHVNDFGELSVTTTGDTQVEEPGFVVYSDLQDQVTVEWTGTIPEDAEAGETFTLAGDALNEPQNRQLFSHTVTVTDDPLEKYRNENGEIDDIGLLEAIADWRNDNLADTQLLELIAEWRDAG